MDSLEDSRRQLRIGFIAIAIIIPIGIVGFMVLEDKNFFDALWMTIITISTIGYGDITAESIEGRVFTIILVIIGLGVFAFAVQAAFSHFISEEVRDLRRRKLTRRKIDSLNAHYIICGEGELVDKTIAYLMEQNEIRREHDEAIQQTHIAEKLKRFFGRKDTGLRAWLRRQLSRFDLLMVHIFTPYPSLLDLIVVVTTDPTYAQHLRVDGLLVIEGAPTKEATLKSAGLEKAQAIMVMLESDTETLLTVLTADSTIRNSEDHEHADIYITAAIHEDDMIDKLLRVGADNVIAPFEVAGQFLNNATMRPAVNEFFNQILFNERVMDHIIQIYVYPDSVWIDRQIGELKLQERYNSGVIGLRTASGDYVYTPPEDYRINVGEILMIATENQYIPAIRNASRPGQTTNPIINNWQHGYIHPTPLQGDRIYTLETSLAAAESMTGHYIICGDDQIIEDAVNNLNPNRPFVVISHEESFTTAMLKRGFCVIEGDPTHQDTLEKAGVDRALALMVSLSHAADSVLTILNARTQNPELLITATAATSDMRPKLYHAGADRVVSPFNIAAQFVLLATTNPAISDFMQHILYNYQTGLETTELYMQTDSPWIGKTIDDLALTERFQAGVVGLRRPNGKHLYAPPGSHVIGENEIMIVITPMAHADELRRLAHGELRTRPATLRNPAFRGYY